MTDVHEVLTCCLCDGPIEHKRTAEGKVYWTQGNDPWPMADEGRCCDVCATVVSSRTTHELGCQTLTYHGCFPVTDGGCYGLRQWRGQLLLKH